MKNKIVKQALAQLTFNRHTGAHREAFQYIESGWDYDGGYIFVIDRSSGNGIKKRVAVRGGVVSMTINQMKGQA